MRDSVYYRNGCSGRKDHNFEGTVTQLEFKGYKKIRRHGFHACGFLIRQ